MDTGRLCNFVRVQIAWIFVAGIAIASTPATASSGGFNVTGSLNVARYGHTAALLPNGQVLVAGGYNTTTGWLTSAELYTPSTGKWSLTGSLHTARFYHAMVLLANGKVLVAGGLDPAGCCGAPPLATAELYDPSTGTWTETGSMTTPRESFAMVPLPNGQVLAAGADNNGGFLSSAELYNPATGTWSATPSMTAENYGSFAVTLQNGQAFVYGNGNLYTPATATWSVVANRPQNAGFGALALLANNNVFSAGGSVYGDEIVNPTTSTWTNVGAAPCTTIHQSCESGVALLTTGKVLVAGGITEVRTSGSRYPTAETNGLAALLDLATLTWASTGSMNKSRTAETATVLQNGQVLFAGGETFDKSLVPTASAELYTP